MNVTTRPDLIIGHQTHAGETGKNNEDRALLRTYTGAPDEVGNVTLAVVADGIGGHRAGEVASQIAVDNVAAVFDNTDSRSYLDLFARAFAAIQQSLTKHIAGNPESEGMGTTCSAVIIANRRLYTAFIGDSRIYLIRDGSIRQISVDHTWVQEAIEHGILTRHEARKHPNRHVVRRHLGAGQDAKPDFRLQLEDKQKPEEARRNQGLPLNPGDIVLVSSDGMTDLVEDHEILAAFEGRSPQAAVEALVLLARQRGGYDNITVTALQIPKASAGAATMIAKRPTARRLALPAIVIAILVAFGVLLLLGLLVTGYVLVFNNPFQATSTATLSPTAAVTATLPPSATLSPTPQAAIIQPDTPTPMGPPPTNTLPPTLPPATTNPPPAAPLGTNPPPANPQQPPANQPPPAASPTFDITSGWLTATALMTQLTPSP